MQIGKCIYFRLLFFIFLPIFAFGQEWQWSVPVRGVNNNARAFLWIPPHCKTIKGLVMAQHNMEEISILENTLFRTEMAKLDFAEIWVSPSPDILKFYDFSNGAAEITQAYLDSLAEVSGYEEIRYAPVVGIGHSAAASWPYYYGAKNPNRTLACISVSGQWPYVRGGNFAPDIWTSDQSLDFIPCLETMGEYEAAATWSKEGLKERKEYPRLPLSMLAVPGEGHFAASDRKVAFIAFYIKKAVQYRMPDNMGSGKAVHLRPVDPQKTGWLVDRWQTDSIPRALAAPVGEYKGNPDEAFWFFDRETAQAAQEYGKAFKRNKPQLVGFIQENALVSQRNDHLQVHMKFLPGSDGITFYLKGGFYETVPGISPRPSIWARLPEGTAIGHSDAGAVSVERICGPFEKVSDTVFRLQLNRGIDLNAEKWALTFAAKHPGDKFYKPAVQQGEMVIPSVLDEGEAQQIQFVEIPDQRSRVKQIDLKATSSAGLPVYFYVLEGPVELKGDRLMFNKIPPKAKFPVKVTVVAWQYGLSSETKIRTAKSVCQSFYIYK